MKRLLWLLLFPVSAFGQPAISSVYVQSSTSTTATIVWTTNVPATSQIKYGTDATIPYANNVNYTLVTSHSMTLNLLTATRPYYFAVVSTASGQTSQSSTYEFALCGSATVPVGGTVNPAYGYGTFAMTWNPPSGAVGTPTVCGLTVATTVTGSLNAFGSLTAVVADSLKVTPGPGSWTTTVTDPGNLAPISVTTPLSAQTQDLSSQLQAAASTAGLVEVIANTVTSKCWPAFVCQGGGGGGSPGGSTYATQYNAGGGVFGGAGPGTTGYVWTSNGPSSPPSFQPATGGIGGSGTADYFACFATSTTIDDCPAEYGATTANTVTIHKVTNINDGSGDAGWAQFTNGTSISGVGGSAILEADTTVGILLLNQNNTGFIPLAPVASGFTSGHCGEPTLSGGVWTIADSGAVCGSGSGTVTSVAETVPSGFAVSGSPITTSGTLAVTYSVSGAGQIINSTGSNAAGFTATPILGVDNSTAGTWQLANGSANAHTIIESGATTSNTISWFATVPTNLHLFYCAVSSTTCQMTDSGYPYNAIPGADVTGVVLTSPSGAQTVTQPVNTNFTVAGSGTGIADFSGFPQFKLPVVAGYTSAASGEIGHDSTNHNWHVWANGADNFMALFPSASPPTSGDCVKFLLSSNVWTIADAGAACNSVGDTITSPHSTIVVGGTVTNTTLDLAGAAGEIMAGSTPALTATPTLGTDNSAAGTLQLADGSANAHTILGSAATTSNTVKFFAAVPTNLDLFYCAVSSTTCTLTDTGYPYNAIPLADLASQSADTMVANMTASSAAPTAVSIPTTAHSVWLAEGTATAPSSAGPGTSGQGLISGGSSADPSYKDFYFPWFIPAANCNNTTAGAGWSIPSGGTVTCRAGTNNQGGYIAITDTSSTFAQFTLAIPENWDTAVDPYIRVQLAYPGTDGGSSHTIIPQIKVSCTGNGGTTTDDIAFQSAHSLSTITLSSASANLFFSTSNVQMNSTDVTNCVAGGLMIVQIGRATDTATSAANFYGATVTFPELDTAQAN